MKRCLIAILLMMLSGGAVAQQEHPLPAGAEQMAAGLETALAELRTLGESLRAADLDSLSLQSRIPREGPLRGLGLQRLRGEEALAWAGWSIPPTRDLPESPAGPLLNLRSYGVFRVLSLAMPDEDGSLWLLDLPLLRTDGAEGPGPPILWDGQLAVLPVEGGRLQLSEASPWEVFVSGEEGGALLSISGQRFLRLYSRPRIADALPRQTSRATLWAALPLLVLGLMLLSRPNLPPPLRRLGMAGGGLRGALVIRGALLFLEPQGRLFDGRDFSLPGLGGLAASPGDLLLSASILFLAFFLLRRLDGEGAAPESPALAIPLAIIPPLAALVLGRFIAGVLLANSSGALLFEGLLPSAPGAALHLGILFIQFLFLLLLLPAARRAWRALNTSWRLILLLLLCAASALIWRSAPMVLAALLLGLALWVPSTRGSREPGVIWLLLPLVISTVFIVQDVQERAQEQYLEALDSQAASSEAGMGRRLLLRRLLGELAGDRELRSVLASGERPDAGFALSLWSRSQLTQMEGPGGLAVYGPRGTLRSRHQVGGVPDPPDLLQPLGRGPDIRIQVLESATEGSFLRGETALQDVVGNLGALMLDIPSEAPRLDRPLSLRERGSAARLMAALSRTSLYLTAVSLLVLVELFLAAAGLPARSRNRRGLEFGFQGRLLGSFLLVALLPTALIGVLGAREVLRQLEEGSERAALQRVQAARSLLESQVRQEAQDLARSEYVKPFVVEDPLFERAPRDLGPQALNEIMIFDRQGRIRLDEMLRNWGQAEADSFLAVLPRDQVVYERSGRNLYAGLLVDTSVRSPRGAGVPLTVYYRMKIGSEQVSDLAHGIGGDLSLYRGGDLLHSNRVEPYGLGWLPPRLRMASVQGLGDAAESAAPLSEPGEDGRFQRALLALPGVDGSPAGVLSSQNPAGRADRRLAMRQATGQVFALASLLLLLALSLGGWLSRRIFVPIQRLQLGTRRVAAGDFSERLAETGGDEIGELVSSFNAMTDRLEEAQREIVRKKRLEAWSEMARQVAHEIKNPLTPIKLSVQHMERAWRDKKPNFDAVFSDTVATLYEQVEILKRIARDFSSFGRGQKLELGSVDLPALAVEVVSPYAGAALDLHLPELETIQVRADREALRKIILNLVENAREAMEEGGRVELRWRRVDGGGELSLRDHGPGIPEELRDRLFEPYFSTKTSGTGLGLAICAQLSEEMGGRLRIENHPEGGAISLLWLPEAADD